MKYVLLLRGVNVGGNHRVPNSELIAVLEKQGFSNVKTYINSGNAVFESSITPNAHEVQNILEKHFGFTIPTLVIIRDLFTDIAQAIPNNWTNDKPTPELAGQKSDVLFLFSEADSQETLSEMGYNPEIETMIYVPGAIIANISRKNQTKGCLQKVIGTKIYSQMTVRNVNTVRKLALMLS